MEKVGHMQPDATTAMKKKHIRKERQAEK